jgi:hypothetical protein
VKVFGEDGAFDYQKKLHQNVQMYTKSGGAGGARPIATGAGRERDLLHRRRARDPAARAMAS